MPKQTEEGTAFTRTHHVVRKTTLYDMDVDPTRKYAVIGCQDRSIRLVFLFICSIIVIKSSRSSSSHIIIINIILSFCVSATVEPVLQENTGYYLLMHWYQCEHVFLYLYIRQCVLISVFSQ